MLSRNTFKGYFLKDYMRYYMPNNLDWDRDSKTNLIICSWRTTDGFLDIRYSSFENERNLIERPLFLSNEETLELRREYKQGGKSIREKIQNKQ